MFPPEVRQPGAADDQSDNTSEKETAVETSATDAQREEIRKDIRKRMKRGELSAEPELEEHHSGPTVLKYPSEGASSDVKAKPSGGSGPKRVPEIEEDTFFGEESDGAVGDEDVDMDES